MSCCLQSEPNALAHSAIPRRPKILCIDDDPTAFEVIAEQLDGYDVELSPRVFRLSRHLEGGD